jgi:translation elongation factor EF-4
MAYIGAGIGGATDWVSYVAASAGLLTQIDGIVYGAKDLHTGWQEAKEKKSTSEISQSQTPMVEELTNFSEQIKNGIAPGLQEKYEELKTQLKKLEAENAALKLQQQQSFFPTFA